MRLWARGLSSSPLSVSKAVWASSQPGDSWVPRGSGLELHDQRAWHFYDLASVIHFQSTRVGWAQNNTCTVADGLTKDLGWSWF